MAFVLVFVDMAIVHDASPVLCAQWSRSIGGRSPRRRSTVAHAVSAARERNAAARVARVVTVDNDDFDYYNYYYYYFYFYFYYYNYNNYCDDNNDFNFNNDS